MWWGRDGFYFDSSFARLSDGSAAEHDGQVWFFDAARSTITLKSHYPYTPADQDTDPDGPDNITVNPYGGLVVCEDGDGVNHLVLDDLRGHTAFLARNRQDSEMAGANFSHDGRFLFANSQDPGVVFAITGPWRGAVAVAGTSATTTEAEGDDAPAARTAGSGRPLPRPGAAAHADATRTSHGARVRATHGEEGGATDPERSPPCRRPPPRGSRSTAPASWPSPVRTGRRSSSGAGLVAARRAAELTRSGSPVLVFAPHLCDDVFDLLAEHLVTWESRWPTRADLAPAWIVHAATGDAGLDARVCALAVAARRGAA